MHFFYDAHALWEIYKESALDDAKPISTTDEREMQCVAKVSRK
jgi:hypothetical protein